jgi:hypothetical protein
MWDSYVKWKCTHAAIHSGRDMRVNQKVQRVRYYLRFNPLKTKRRLLYLKTQLVPRSKHFPSRL